MRRVFRSQHVRAQGEEGFEGGEGGEVIAPELTDEEIKAALAAEELKVAIAEIEKTRMDSLRALGIPVDE